MADRVFTSTTQTDRINSVRYWEKPWKPYPPKRSISLTKTDGGVATPSGEGRNRLKPVDAEAPAFVSIVPIDTRRRQLLRYTGQEKPENERKMTSGENSGSTLTRNSLLREFQATHLFVDHQHGFNMRQNLNLRGKNPSRDRWTMSTGSNFDPYLYEDDLLKVSSRSSNQKLDNIAKNKPSASFLLCASRKSMKSGWKEDIRQPFRKTSNETETPHQSSSARIIEYPNKRQKVSSSKANKDFDIGKQNSDHVTATSHRQIPSSAPSSSHVSTVSMETALSESDQRSFFSSVATVSRQHTFWSGPKTRRARPVRAPQLTGPVPTTQIPGPVQSPRRAGTFAKDVGTKYPSTFAGSSDEFCAEKMEVPAPCSLQVISETSGEKIRKYLRSELSVQQSVTERKNERNGAGDQSVGVAVHQSQGGFPHVGKAGHQSPYFPSNLKQKTFSASLTSDEYNSRFVQENSQFKPKFSDERLQPFCGDIVSNENGIHCRGQTSPLDSSDISSEGQYFPGGNPEGSSLRSSTASDWFSARDCTSSSVGVDSINSDPVYSECESDKSSRTWLSRVKKVFGTMWAILMPSFSTKKLLSSADPDALSDVDSGCSVGIDRDLSTLQRSPSEMSELEKLAALANRIAADRRRRKEPFEISSVRHPNDAAFYELTQLTTSSSSRAGSPRNLECISEMVEETSGNSNRCLRSSFGGASGGMPFPAVGNTSPNPDCIRNDLVFDSSQKSLPVSGNCFSNVPFAGGRKVHDDLGKTTNRREGTPNIVRKDVVQYGELAFDEKFENISSKISSKEFDYARMKYEISQIADEVSNCNENVNRRSAFDKDDRLTYDQLLLLADFSVSPELEKAIEKLTVTSSDNIQMDPKNTALQPFRTSIEVEGKTEMENSLPEGIRTGKRGSSTSDTGGRMIRSATAEIPSTGVFNGVRSSGCSVQRSPENPQLGDTYCFTTDSGVTLRVYPATIPTSVENFAEEPRSSGENFGNKEIRRSMNPTPPAKQHLPVFTRTKIQNSGSLIPRPKTSFISENPNENDTRNRSENISRPSSPKVKSNESTVVFAPDFHGNSTSTGHQVARGFTATPGTRIREGVPSPTVQRTRASKIAFLTGQNLN